MNNHSYTSERADPSFYQSTPEDLLILLAHEKTYSFVSPFVADQCVLDLGCGEGYGSHMLSQSARQVVGVDVSRESVDRAQDKYGSGKVSFEWISAIGDSKLPFCDDHFDSVVCFHVIEHVAKDRLVVQEIRRVLKKDGVAFLSTPNASFRLLPFQNPWNRFHVKEYTRESLSRLMGKEFPKQKMMGITFREPWLEFEKTRSIRNRTILWPITNKMIPDSARRALLHQASNLLSLVKKKEQSVNSANVPVAEDIIITSESIEKCSTLLVIAGQNPGDLGTTGDNQEP